MSIISKITITDFTSWSKFILLLIACLFSLFASSLKVEAQEPHEMILSVDGKIREALMYPGNQTLGESTPLILVFHGYGGSSKDLKNAKGLANYLKIHELWPEAIVVYGQGLVIPPRDDGRIKPGKEKPGWQRTAEMDGGRDLRYVDEIIETIDELFKMDRKRVYASGFSNGGLFTWVLLKARADTISAFAPIGATDNGNIYDATVPRPVIFHYGEQDEAFEMGWAQKSVRRVKRINKSTAESHQWSENSTWFEHEEGGAPFVWHLHPKGHIIPPYAAANIVRFFQEITPE